jgi:hypothetical protein
MMRTGPKELTEISYILKKNPQRNPTRHWTQQEMQTKKMEEKIER